MFVGSINQDTRAIVAGLAPAWKDRKLYVGCSGNFTIERLAWKAGVREIYSNDVSLYSCAVGTYLAGRDLEVKIRDTATHGWLEGWIKPGPPLIATLLIASEFFKFMDREGAYHDRMRNAYLRRWETMHSGTVEVVKKALDTIKVAEFFAGDVVEFARNAPEDCVFVAFPPTYKSGYERLYKKIDEVFDWPKPQYTLFDETSFELFQRDVRSKRTWLTMRDHAVPDMKEHHIATVQTGLRSKQVFLYANRDEAKLTLPHQKTEQLNAPPLRLEVGGRLSLLPITGAHMNHLRSLYLDPKIAPSAALINVAVFLGAISLGRSGSRGRNGVRTAST